jgi:hypothetical protein
MDDSQYARVVSHKPEVTWDYFDTQLFEFDSGYIDSIKEIVEESGVLMHLSGSLE